MATLLPAILVAVLMLGAIAVVGPFHSRSDLPDPQPSTRTRTAQQVAAQAETTIRAAAAAAELDSRLIRGAEPDITACTESEAAAEAGMVQVRRTFSVPDLPDDVLVDAMRAIRGHLLGERWTFTQEEGLGTARVRLSAVQPFTTTTLRIRSQDQSIAFTLTSACLWPQGTPPTG